MIRIQVTTLSAKSCLRQSRYKAQELFRYFKESLPSGAQEDGCSTRAIWINKVCEGLGFTMKYAVVSSPDANGDPDVIRIKPPMPDQGWRYHIVPVLLKPTGEQVIFDLCLDKAVTLSEWKECFESGSQFTIGEDELAKKHSELDFEYPQQLTLRMQHLWCRQVCSD